jgi:hypothetical protein
MAEGLIEAAGHLGPEPLDERRSRHRGELPNALNTQRLQRLDDLSGEA